MKEYKGTHKGKSYRYFYDRGVRFWTVYELDGKGNQIGDAEYYNDKKQLVEAYPKFK